MLLLTLGLVVVMLVVVLQRLLRQLPLSQCPGQVLHAMQTRLSAELCVG